MRVPGTEWTAKEYKILHALWERRTKGERTVDLAKEIHVTPTQLYKLWNRLGYNPTKIRKRLNEKGISEIFIMRHRGASYPDICRALGMEPTRANTHKVAQRLRNWHKRTGFKYKKHVDEEAEKVYEMRREGLSYKDIALRLEKDPDAKTRAKLSKRMCGWCRKNGIAIPSTNQGPPGSQEEPSPTDHQE